MKTLQLYISVVIVFLFVSCGSSGGGGDPEPEQDRTAPTINIKSPSANTSHTAGNDLTINVSLTDNEDLKSYVIVISFNGAKSTKSVEEFNYNSDQDNAAPIISGTSYSINYNIEVPDNTKSGNYKFKIDVNDSSGNKSNKEVVFSIE